MAAGSTCRSFRCDASRKAPSAFAKKFDADCWRGVFETSISSRFGVEYADVDESITAFVGVVESKAFNSSPETPLFSRHAFPGAVQLVTHLEPEVRQWGLRNLGVFREPALFPLITPYILGRPVKAAGRLVS